MSATLLFKAGYTDLVSVIPPNAPLTPGSKIDPDQRGKVPGRKYSTGWGGYNWLDGQTEARDVAKWERDGANIGLRGSRFPALDIDSNDRNLTKVIEDLARRKLGQAPVRLSTGDRRLMVYRTDEPFSRMAIKVQTKDGSWHLIEFLGEGRQYLVHGRHPSGAEYRWQGAPLWKIPPASLTAISRGDVEQFFSEVEAYLRPRGLKVERVGDGVLEKDAPPIESLMAPSIEALEALPLPPNPAHYGWDEFIKHGYAYAAAGADDPARAFALWDAWAQQHPDYDAELTALQWEKGFANPRVGWTWLQEQAEATGEYLSAQDEFEAMPLNEIFEEVAGGPEEEFEKTDEDLPDLKFIMPASELAKYPALLEPPACVIPRIAYRGRMTILAGPDKAGKSTLLAHALASVSRGTPFLGEEAELTYKRGLLVGLEEALGDQVRRFVDLGGDLTRLLHVAKPNEKDFLKRLEVWLKQCPVDVVVIDSLQEYARLTERRVPEDGDNAGWGKIVRPLVQLARDLDVGLVILHHTRRSDGQARGAGEILAAADVLLEMAKPKDSTDPVRNIEGRGRLWRVEPFSVVLGEDGYRVTNGEASITLRERVLAYIAGNPGVGSERLKEAMGKRKADVQKVVDELISQGLIEDRMNGKNHHYHMIAGGEFPVVTDHGQTEDEENGSDGPF